MPEQYIHPADDAVFPSSFFADLVKDRRRESSFRMWKVTLTKLSLSHTAFPRTKDVSDDRTADPFVSDGGATYQITDSVRMNFETNGTVYHAWLRRKRRPMSAGCDLVLLLEDAVYVVNASYLLNKSHP